MRNDRDGDGCESYNSLSGMVATLYCESLGGPLKKTILLLRSPLHTPHNFVLPAFGSYGTIYLNPSIMHFLSLNCIVNRTPYMYTTRCMPEHHRSSKDITFRCSLLLFFPLTSPSSHLQIIMLSKHPIMIDTQCITTSSTPVSFLSELLLLVVAILPFHPLHSTSTTGALMEAIGTSFDDGLWGRHNNLALVQEVSVCLFMHYLLCSGDGDIVGNFCGQDSLSAITRAAFL